MKRVMKALVRLYPLRWRERYGAEFEALLDDREPSALDAVDVFCGALKMQMNTWTPIRIVVGFSILGALAMFAISLLQPVHSVARVRVLVMSADEPASSAANRLIQQSVDRQTLALLIQRLGLYPRDVGRLRDPKSVDALIDKMARDIRVTAAPAASLPNGDIAGVDVQFDYPDTRVAVQVSQQLTGLLMARNLHAQKSHVTMGVLDPPAIVPLPKGAGSVQLAFFGLLGGVLVGLLATGLIKSLPNYAP